MTGPKPRQSLPDFDPEETDEWLESIRSVVESHGVERARMLLHELMIEAKDLSIPINPPSRTPYLNTISLDQQPPYPGDLEIEKKIQNSILWNAAVVVSDTNRRIDGIGGHISTYASSSTLYEVGFNHIFRGKDSNGIGDAIYIQGHGSPGIYARAFLEGRISREQMINFRQEVFKDGLSSYPHPRLMPEFWEYTTVSMGLGPLAAVMHARFWKYLHQRGLADTSQSRVFAFLGDGEMDEPESIASIAIAGRENLDNLIVVVNCNLQRLDGPVRGNSKIIQELEGLYRGAGWTVIKVLWSSGWDRIMNEDSMGVVLSRIEAINDGDWQRMGTLQPSEFRKEFFSGNDLISSIGESLSDAEIEDMRRGGHDPRKVYAAYKCAEAAEGPSVILSHTVKGWGIDSFEGRNSSHQKKKMALEDLIAYRDSLKLPIDDETLENAPLYHPGEDSDEIDYLRSRREALGGYLPSRRSPQVDIKAPEESTFSEFDGGTREGLLVSTTMVFVRLLRKLLKSDMGSRVVPIIPDEGRTFGMDPLFSEFGIFSQFGQNYTPVDHKMLMNYKESESGQIIQEGIAEATSMATWTAAATSYSHSDSPTLPFYIFYSMFGFQRVADLIWSAADSRARGFLIGATSGRTTLNGEGLQHQDGHSLLMAHSNPAVRAYDPAFAFELSTIIKHGIVEMFEQHKDVIYYLAVYNENYPMPAKPKGCEEGILKGLYKLRDAPKGDGPLVRLIGSGPIMLQVLDAVEKLETYGVRSEIWSATSYGELRREGMDVSRWNRLHPHEAIKSTWVEQQFGDATAPIIAVSDNVAAVPEMIREWVSAPFTVLGTDGFGRSDTRPALRRFFEIDGEAVALAALSSLVREGQIEASVYADAMASFGVSADRTDITSL